MMVKIKSSIGHFGQNKVMMVKIKSSIGHFGQNKVMEES